MRTHHALLALFFGLLCIVSQAHSIPQDSERVDSTVTRIVLLDGNTLIGTIVAEDSDVIEIDAVGYGRLRVNRNRIENIVSSTPEEMFGPVRNPQAATRYFWSPNARGMNSGEAYYQNVWLLFNQVAFGVSDNVSFGFGFVPLFLFAGTATPVWATVKVCAPMVEDVLSVGVGGLAGMIVSEDGGESIGLGYGIITLGNEKYNASVNVGYGMLAGEISESPMISISGMAKISSKSYIVTENFIIDGDILASFGFRTVFADVGLDYGLVVPVFADKAIAIPWLGVSIPF